VFNGSYDETTGVWNAGSIGSGGAALLIVRATVNATGNYTNTATRTASFPTDPVAGNNSASASTTPH